MGKINVLSFDVANLIAAGEVVDRPASVVKELLENAIDAGATAVTVEIRHGGVSMIRVADNGCGIEPEDLPVAIKRHATSKIKEADDLASIMTLGFRGEALAAIASVCQMHIITKPKARDMGMMLVSDGGRVTEITEIGCADGTTVTVENLFGNVPARRKFLKKDVTEAMAVSAVVEKVAMSRPDIALTLISDGNTRFSTAGDGKLENTLYALFGREFAARLLPVTGELDGIRISGFIGRPDFVRNNRNYQNTFINSRYVKSKTVMAAVEKAFTSFIAPERFPISVLFLTLDPAAVDVNVHPAKLEVKFSDERPVFEAVYYAVRSALEESTERPEMHIKTEKRPAIGAFVPVGGAPKAEQTDLSAWLKVPGATSRPVETVKVTPPPAAAEKKATETSYRTDYRSVYEKIGQVAAKTAVPETVRVASPLPSPSPTQTETKKPTEPETPPPLYRLIGEAFDCYVIVELDGELLLIDKHAAHERILFEELKENMQKDGRIASQSLLLPIRVRLSEQECAAAIEYKNEIESVGFLYTLDGGDAELSALPDAITPADAEMLFIKMTDELASGTGNPAVTETLRRERALYQIACKGAIKGGRVYSTETLRWLVEKLLRMPDVTCCPHGRPVAYRLTKSELDRQFERI